MQTKPQVVQDKAHLNVCGFGMNLHAATTVDGRDRKRLERLCRYLLRPLSPKMPSSDSRTAGFDFISLVGARTST